MFRQAGILCAALAMFFIAGGHWAVLQSVAWAQMLGDYSQHTGSVAVAVAQTFDGQHPCGLCREIQAAKSREHNDPSAVSTEKEDFRVKALLAEAAPLLPERTATRIIFPRAVAPRATGRTEPPPVPPPRGRRLAA